MALTMFDRYREKIEELRLRPGAKLLINYGIFEGTGGEVDFYTDHTLKRVKGSIFRFRFVCRKDVLSERTYIHRMDPWALNHKDIEQEELFVHRSLIYITMMKTDYPNNLLRFST